MLSAVPGHRRWALALASTAGAAALVAAAVPAASAAPVAARVVKATSPASGSATYHGRLGHSARVAHSASGVSGLRKVSSRLAASDRLVPFRSPGGIDPAKRSSGAQAPGVRAGAVVRGAATVTAAAPAVLHKFNGVSDLDSDNLNATPVTPPDQGLCVGRDRSLPGSPKAVWEPVNIAARETSVNGTALFPDITLTTLFQDPFAEGDPRCLYDSATHTFFFTEIGFPPGGPNASLTNTTLDVTVLNANGAAFYQFDTSFNRNFQSGTCLGDQPKVGFNNNALIVSTDQFCGATRYSAAKGAYVLYPAIQPRQHGPAALVFTITSRTKNPSAAFTTVNSATIKTVAAGAGPHVSFAEVQFNQSRWGDYTFAVPDPSGNGVWMATEYIPPPASQDPQDNWGTFVFEVSGH